MKKILFSIGFILISYLVLMVQWIYSNSLTIFNVKSNLIILVVAFLLVYTNRKEAIKISLIIGTIFDLTVSQIFGITPITLLISIIIMSKINKIFNTHTHKSLKDHSTWKQEESLEKKKKRRRKFHG